MHFILFILTQFIFWSLTLDFYPNFNINRGQNSDIQRILNAGKPDCTHKPCTQTNEKKFQKEKVSFIQISEEKIFKNMPSGHCK